MTTSIEDSFANWLSNLDFVRRLGKVFVVGSPKSGTTWLQDLLHAHPEMVVNGEGRFTWRLLPVLQQAFSAFNKDQKQHSPKAITVLRDCDLAMTARAIMDGQFSRYIVESGKDHTRIKVVGDKTLMPDVNLRYCLVVTLQDGHMTFDASHDAARMTSPAVRSLGERIDFLGPKAGQDRFAVTIEVQTREGTLTGFQDRNVPGRYENPMSRQEVESKALELMLPVIGDAQARLAIELIDRLETLTDLDALVSALRPAGQREGA